MAAAPRHRAPQDRRSEEAIQRATVALLRAMLPAGAVVHHSHQNIRARGDKARVQGGILKGLGVVAGFPDLTIIAERETPGPAVMFIELKAARGTLSPEQKVFRDLCASLGLPWALARSEADALAAVRAAGFRTRHHQRAPREEAGRTAAASAGGALMGSDRMPADRVDTWQHVGNVAQSLVSKAKMCQKKNGPDGATNANPALTITDLSTGGQDGC